jgi:hypothetical protein
LLADPAKWLIHAPKIKVIFREHRLREKTRATAPSATSQQARHDVRLQQLERRQRFAAKRAQQRILPEIGIT